MTVSEVPYQNSMLPTKKCHLILWYFLKYLPGCTSLFSIICVAIAGVNYSVISADISLAISPRFASSQHNNIHGSKPRTAKPELLKNIKG
ncbi:hypothetical protein BVRB_000450 [Beta vulgaris subsp. vulgaris]|uniref:Uncharacterized protein n=1 Tax=Beta vulgaris subsp. vulgaris TaxID=3555 RepID=A0A0J8B4X7_BETVV|nr:hypothetical protein BVRB_000450 [Beta vulgaris subsp. vulgaris]